MTRFAVLVLAVLPVAVFAQEDPIVRVEVEPDSVAVGEAMRLRVTVLVPTFFSKPPTYPDFELANVITRLPADSSFPTSERVGGTSWAGIIRDYRLYPLTGARYRIDDATIGVTYAIPGGDPVTATVPVPEISFAGIVPAGAESLDPYVAGNRLSLTLDVSGSEGELKAGDAVVLEYRATLYGLPAIFLPPIAPELEYEGASVYADQPKVDDGPPATRTEKLTIVFNTGGTIEVPGVSLDYWNTESGSIETVTAGTVAFEVTGPPPAESVQPDNPEPAIDWQWVALIFLVLALLIIIIRALAPPILARMHVSAAKRRADERYAFRQLNKALKNGQSHAAYAALLEWTSRLETPMDSRDFAAKYGDDQLVVSLEAFFGAQFGGAGNVDLGLLRTQLVRARRNFKSSRTVDTKHDLPPLNPGTPGAAQ